jgi:hypothetical protein
MNHCTDVDCYLEAHICCTGRLAASVAEARLLVTKLHVTECHTPGFESRSGDF